MKSLALCCALFVAMPAMAETMLFDFGRTDSQSPFTPGVVGWNNITRDTTDLFAIFDDAGAVVPGVSLSVTDEFYNAGEPSNNPATTFTGDAAQFPETAARDFMFGHTVFGQFPEQPTAAFELNGLTAGQGYDITIFGYRSTSQNRETQYTVTGATTEVGLLNPGNNTSEVVTFSGIVPDGSGTISVGLQAGANNESGSLFYYINAMSVTTAVPEPATGSLLLLAGALCGVARRR